MNPEHGLPLPPNAAPDTDPTHNLCLDDSKVSCSRPPNTCMSKPVAFGRWGTQGVAFVTTGTAAAKAVGPYIMD